MASNRTIELLIVISAKLIMVQLTTRGETSTFSLGGRGGGVVQICPAKFFDALRILCT